MTHPDLMRLMTWFGLEQKVDNPDERASVIAKKIEEVKKAQADGRVGTVFSPGFLLTVIMALATAWTKANPFGSSLDPGGTGSLDALKRNIAEAVRRLTRPTIGA